VSSVAKWENQRNTPIPIGPHCPRQPQITRNARAILDNSGQLREQEVPLSDGPRYAPFRNRLLDLVRVYPLRRARP